MLQNQINKIKLRSHPDLIEELICACIEEYHSNPDADITNIIEFGERPLGSSWVGQAWKAKILLNGHKYDIFVDEAWAAVSTRMTAVGFKPNLGDVFLGGAKHGSGGFYVTGQRGAQLISISSPTSSTAGLAAYYYLKDLFIKLNPY
ncbi:MAG TPA: hypothetical protein VI603_19015 [Saprospiraceae bacterium]|nr:hypothetical protein [Saprospiraceae bacterium]